MFFRKKDREQNSVQPAVTSLAVQGTAPELVEVTDLVISAAAEETVNAGVIAPRAEDADAVRLFPGFEHDEFEVGFRADRAAPALVMRWKDGGEWFTVPPIFNRGVLAAMDERESSTDLNRLLRNYGYDVDAINR